MENVETFWLHCWRDQTGSVIACAIEDGTCEHHLEMSGEPLPGLPFEQKLIYSHRLESSTKPTISKLVFTDDGLFFDGQFCEQEDFGDWHFSRTLTEWCSD